MDKRIRIGIINIWGQTWLGGTYYISNLIYALNTLQEDKKPIIDVYCKSDKDFDNLLSETGYPYLVKNTIKRSIFRKAYNYILYHLSKKLYYRSNTFVIQQQDVVIYPYNYGTKSDKLLFWRPDFQEKYYPEYFLPNTIKNRDLEISEVCERGIPIIFSSKDSQDDFKKFFPQYMNHTTYVVHFAVHQPNFYKTDINLLKEKFGITKPYLLCANQFWKHKNHSFLFRAFKKALDKGLDLQLVCTGKMMDYRDPVYVEGLLDYVKNNNLGNDILTLGVINKTELLCLMKNSYAVIQPSLFEGWNTTVEDCKAMSKYIFLSDLNVHREQIEKNVCFFNPNDEDDLTNKLLTTVPMEEEFDYSLSIKEFAESFMKIVHSKNLK